MRGNRQHDSGPRLSRARYDRQADNGADGDGRNVGWNTTTAHVNMSIELSRGSTTSFGVCLVLPSAPDIQGIDGRGRLRSSR